MRNCSSIQEAIALDQALTPDQRSHLNQCDKCKVVLQEYKQLEDLFSLNFEVNVPDTFADTVMNRIEEESLMQDDWFSNLQARIASFLSEPAPQWALVSFGVAMSASNILRFVLYILTPAGN
jgi:hypothetical protein